jgi:hypothetical protein
MKKAITLFILLACMLANGKASAQLLKRLRERKAKAATPSTNTPEQKVTKNGRLPRYETLNDWAAHPYKHDNADSVPAELQYEKRDSIADVFFIHPTSYTQDFKTSNWNADMDDAAINAETENRSILNQASAFNGSCRVYAPHYRQAHLKVFFLKNNPQSRAALDTAYADVKAAFLYYLQHWNKGRPIIIASHSQGSVHAIRLLQDLFDAQPLQKQLVCAYIVGWGVKKTDFKNIPPGTKPTSVNCFVSWRTYKDGFVEKDIERENGTAVCVNPITWYNNEATSKSVESKGAMISKNFQTLLKGIVQARVDTLHHILWVQLPQAVESKLGQLNNYHILDYNLFWMDVRYNVQQRLKAWQTR